jgi:predicted amidohydrolase YtcJ
MRHSLCASHTCASSKPFHVGATIWRTTPPSRAAVSGAIRAELQALRAATLTAAEALSKDNELGSVEPGKLADILILNADPLPDIYNASRIELIIKGGRQYRPAELLSHAQ